MKQLVLLILVLAVLLLVADNQRTTIQMMIVIPPELVPYYDWLLSFPGWPSDYEISNPDLIPVTDL